MKIMKQETVKQKDTFNERLHAELLALQPSHYIFTDAKLLKSTLIDSVV